MLWNNGKDNEMKVKGEWRVHGSRGRERSEKGKEGCGNPRVRGTSGGHQERGNPRVRGEVCGTQGGDFNNGTGVEVEAAGLDRRREAKDLGVPLHPSISF